MATANVTLSHKIRLHPTVAQEAYFRRACGTARFAYNWGLVEWNRQYEVGSKPTAFALRKQFNAIYPVEFPWISDVLKDAHDQPFINLGVAFKRFFDGTSERPTFKKKGKCADSFYIGNIGIKLNGKSIRIARLGWVKMREALRFSGKIMSVVVSCTAGKWFVSIAVEMTYETAARPRTGTSEVGVDVGITHAAILSTGEKIEAPKPLKKALRRLRIRSRRLSRTAKRSANFKKQTQRIAQVHYRIANVRSDFWHKLSARLCRENQAVGVESLNCAGMVQNHKLARALNDVAFGMLLPMLLYKAPLYGTEVIQAPRFFLSTKTCSTCGVINDVLTLKDRVWTCACGVVHDRDINAAKNLEPSRLLAVSQKVTPVRYDTAPEAGQGRNRSNSQTQV